MKSKMLFAGSGLIFVFLALIVTFFRKNTITPPTAATINQLYQYELPPAPSFPGKRAQAGDANSQYREAAQFFTKNYKKLRPEEDTYTAKKEKLKVSMKLSDMLIQAADMKAKQPFLDDHIVVSLTDRANASKEEAVTIGFGTVCVEVVQQLIQDKHMDEAFETMRALFVYGDRCYRLGRLLPLRDIGLSNMENAAELISFHFSEHEKYRGIARELTDYKAEITKALGFYSKKKRVLQNAQPHVGDLLNIALNDKEYCFRVEAVRRMGLAKWNPKTIGNREMIDEIITKAKQSSDSYMKVAGETAGSITKEEFHRQ